MLALLRKLRRHLTPLLAAGFALGLLAGATEAADVQAHEGHGGTVAEVAAQEASHHGGHEREHHDLGAEAPEDTAPPGHHAGHGCDACTCLAASGGCSGPVGVGPGAIVPSGPPAAAGLAAWPTLTLEGRLLVDIFRPPRL